MTDYKELCTELTEELALYFRLSKPLDDQMRDETYELIMRARKVLVEE